jgi:hypothetical protein
MSRWPVKKEVDLVECPRVCDDGAFLLRPRCCGTVVLKREEPDGESQFQQGSPIRQD